MFKRDHQLEVPSEEYNKHDLENAVDYCKDLQEHGFEYEPMDHFSLVGFIRWAEQEALFTPKGKSSGGKEEKI